MFKLMDKKRIAILRKLFLLNWPYDISGTGKTMVSVMLMSTMLEMFPTRLVLFVVDKVLLVLQQSKYITEELGEFHFPRYVWLN